MTITKDDVANTFNRFVMAGKKMPFDISSNNRNAGRDLDRLVQEWLFLFGETGIELWHEAERIAMTLTQVNSLNCNLVTPGLMAEALSRAEKIHLERQQQKAAEHKDTKVNIKISNYMTYANSYMLAWLNKRIKLCKDFPILKNMPSDQAVYDYAHKLGVQVVKESTPHYSDAAFNFGLLRIYLSDIRHCKNMCSGGKCDSRFCYLKGEIPTVSVEDSQIRLGSARCGL